MASRVPNHGAPTSRKVHKSHNQVCRSSLHNSIMHCTTLHRILDLINPAYSSMSFIFRTQIYNKMNIPQSSESFSMVYGPTPGLDASGSISYSEISATATVHHWSQDPHSRNSREAAGIRPNVPMLPIMQQRDLIEREMRWLIPLGVAHLQSLWEDDETDSRILDAVMDYALTTSGDTDRDRDRDRESQGGEFEGDQQRRGEEEGHSQSPSQYQSNTHFYSSPYELLMTLDVARRSVRAPFLYTYFLHFSDRSYYSLRRSTHPLLFVTPQNAVLYRTLLCCCLLHCAILYYTVLHYPTLYYTILYCTVLYCTALYYTILYYTILYCTVLYCTVLYKTILYFTVQ